MSEQRISVSATLVPAQKKPLYQSKTLRSVASVALLGYLFSLFMLTFASSACVDCNGIKQLSSQIIKPSMHSDERYMKVVQQQQIWPDNPLFIVDQTLKQPLFRLPAEHLFSALIDSISSPTLSAMMRCMSRGFAKIFSRFHYLL